MTSRRTAGQGTGRTATSGADSGREARGRTECLWMMERESAARCEDYLTDARIAGGGVKTFRCTRLNPDGDSSIEFLAGVNTRATPSSRARAWSTRRDRKPSRPRSRTLPVCCLTALPNDDAPLQLGGSAHRGAELRRSVSDAGAGGGAAAAGGTTVRRGHGRGSGRAARRDVGTIPRLPRAPVRRCSVTALVPTVELRVFA